MTKILNGQTIVHNNDAPTTEYTEDNLSQLVNNDVTRADVVGIYMA